MLSEKSVVRGKMDLKTYKISKQSQIASLAIYIALMEIKENWSQNKSENKWKKQNL